MKIYRKCTSEPYSFLTIDTTLISNNSKIQKKSFISFIKMTLIGELKILDDKIKTNQAKYDLDREAANFFLLLSNELDKYKYLTGEGLEKEDKKEQLLKRLKSIEGGDEEQLKTIQYQLEKQVEILTSKTDKKS